MCVIDRRKYSVNDNFLDVIDSQEKAYLLGLWYADGTVYDKTNHIKIDLIDKELLEKVKSILNYDGNIKEYEGEIKYFGDKQCKCKKTYRLSIYSKQLVKRLIELGCVPNKTYILKFPTEKQLPKKFIRHFIRGYIDGDGGISYWIDNENTKHKKFQINCCGTTDIINTIADIIREKFNCKPSITDRFPDRDNNNLQFSICGNRKVKEILDWIYKDAKIYMKRKYDKYLELKEECDRIDNDKTLYGNAYKRRKVINLYTLEIYESVSEAGRRLNFKQTSVATLKCKRHDGIMYLDEYEEMKNKERINND